MEYTIDKNIPIPTGRSKWTSVVDSMKVGDSILLPDRKEVVSLAAVLKRRDFKAVTRLEGGGIRVWKVLREGTDDLDQEYEKLLLEQEDKDEYQVNT
tara:strand:- start:261 stop:551 length:291 start_codon:yes stop_codon:yes gene_type:complete